MNEKLKPNKTYGEFKKRAEANLDEMNKEIENALNNAHKKNPNLGIGGYKEIENPIREKYYKKHLELCKEFFDI